MEHEITYYLLFVLSSGTHDVEDYAPFKYREDNITIRIGDKEYTDTSEGIRQKARELGYDSLIFEKKDILTF